MSEFNRLLDRFIFLRERYEHSYHPNMSDYGENYPDTCYDEQEKAAEEILAFLKKEINAS